MADKHGGKRTGAGRKRGALNAETLNIRELARQHTQDAISALVEVVSNPESSQRAQAASILLDRGYGRVKPESDPDISPIMQSLKAGEITALNAGLSIEGMGARLPKTVEMLLVQELNIQQPILTDGVASFEIMEEWLADATGSDEAAALTSCLLNFPPPYQGEIKLLVCRSFVDERIHDFQCVMQNQGSKLPEFHQSKTG